MKPIEPLLDRALKHAIGYCRTQYEALMSSELPGAPPTPAALRWRAQATEYNRFLKKIQPREQLKQKGAAG